MQKSVCFSLCVCVFLHHNFSREGGWRETNGESHTQSHTRKDQCSSSHRLWCMPHTLVILKSENDLDPRDDGTRRRVAGDNGPFMQFGSIHTPGTVSKSVIRLVLIRHHTVTMLQHSWRTRTFHRGPTARCPHLYFFKLVKLNRNKKNMAVKGNRTSET